MPKARRHSRARASRRRTLAAHGGLGQRQRLAASLTPPRMRMIFSDYEHIFFDYLRIAPVREKARRRNTPPHTIIFRRGHISNVDG